MLCLQLFLSSLWNFVFTQILPQKKRTFNAARIFNIQMALQRVNHVFSFLPRMKINERVQNICIYKQTSLPYRLRYPRARPLYSLLSSDECFSSTFSFFVFNQIIKRSFFPIISRSSSPFSLTHASWDTAWSTSWQLKAGRASGRIRVQHRTSYWRGGSLPDRFTSKEYR